MLQFWKVLRIILLNLLLHDDGLLEPHYQIILHLSCTSQPYNYSCDFLIRHSYDWMLFFLLWCFPWPVIICLLTLNWRLFYHCIFPFRWVRQLFLYWRVTRNVFRFIIFSIAMLELRFIVLKFSFGLIPNNFSQDFPVKFLFRNFFFRDGNFHLIHPLFYNILDGSLI